MERFIADRFSRDMARLKEDAVSVLEAFEQDMENPLCELRFRSAIDYIKESALSSVEVWKRDMSFALPLEEEDISPNKKRLRKKSVLFDPSFLPDDEEEIIIHDHDITQFDVDSCRKFLELVRIEDYTLPDSAWFNKRYGQVLQMIRSNLGAQGSNEPALATWDDLTRQSMRYPNSIEVQSMRKKKATCNLCNLPRTCSYKAGGYIFGDRCADLAKAAIKFFETLSLCADGNVGPVSAIERMDDALSRIQEAHAGKSFE